jgi:integrase
MGFLATLGDLGDAAIGEWAVGAAQAEFTRPRTVPIPPELVVILRTHIENFGVASDGRIFSCERGHPVGFHGHQRCVGRRSHPRPHPCPGRLALAGRPYDLRHAGVSLWLAAGVPAPRVAERAGHSVEVLLRLYAKCLGDDETIANTRIDLTLINLVRTYPVI